MPGPPQSTKVLEDELVSACGAGLLQTVVTMHQQIEESEHSQRLLDRMLEEAAEKGKAKVVEYCLTQDASITPMAIACALDGGSPEVYDLFLSAGLDVNRDLESLGDALISSASTGKLHLVSFLLSKGADPKTTHLLFRTYGVLAAAAIGGSVKITAMLLERGATLIGSGALIVAAERGTIEMVRYLLAQGADIHEIGIENQDDARTKQFTGTALHIAAAQGHVDVVEVLLSSGADAARLDTQGRTALQRAKEAGHEEVVKIIRASKL